MSELEAVLDIIDYLRAQGLQSFQYMEEPERADLDDYTKEVWKDLIHYGLGERLWKAAFPK